MAKLKEICTFYTGTGFPTKYQGRDNGNYAFYKVGDIASNVQAGYNFLSICNNYVTDDVVKAIKGCILPKDTIVFAKIGEAIKLNRRVITSDKCLVDNNVMGIAPNTEVLGLDYFFYFMKNLKMEDLAESTTIPSVRKSKLEEVEITLLEKKEQEQVSKVLNLLSNVIWDRKVQLEQLDALARARFVEMFGDTVFNTKSWDMFNLDEMANIVSGITKGRKTRNEILTEVPYMAVSNVKDGYIDWTTVKTILATRTEIEQYRLLPSDILMTEGGDPDKVGRGAIIHQPLKNCIHQNHIFRVRLNTDKVLPAYFSEYLKNPKAKQYFLGCAKQTTGIASINMMQIKALPVITPPMNIQKKYAAFVAQTDKSKVAIQKSLNEAQILFDSLMQEYFG